MRSRSRYLLGITLAVALSAAPAMGQEVPPPARAELGAFPGGGVLFTSGHSGEPLLTNYTFGASVTWNLSPRIGVELEAGFGLGGRKAVTFAGQSLKSQPMPDTISYSADLVFTPGSRRHAMVPYVLVGAGALSLVQRPGTDVLGITSTDSFLTGNAGGGVKWYAVRAWGVRADYRLMIVQHQDAAPAFFGGLETRYGHRVYASVFTTF